MVQKVRDPVKGDRCLPAPRRALDDQDPVLRVPDDLILLLLDRAHNTLQLGVATVPELLL